MEDELVEQYLETSYGVKPEYLASGSYGHCWKVGDSTVKVFRPLASEFCDIEVSALHSLVGIDFNTAAVPVIEDSGQIIVGVERYPFIKYSYMDGEVVGVDGLKSVPTRDVAEFLAQLHSGAKMHFRDNIGLVDNRAKIEKRIGENSWPQGFESFALSETRKLDALVGGGKLGDVARLHNDVTPDNLLHGFNESSLAVVDFGNMTDLPHEYEFRHIWRFDPDWTRELIADYDDIRGVETNVDAVEALAMLRTIYLVAIVGRGGNWERALPFARYLPEDVYKLYETESLKL